MGILIKLRRFVKNLFKKLFFVLFRKEFDTYNFYTALLNCHKKKKKIKIVIFMTFAESWNSYLSFYESAKEHKNIDISIVLFPKVSKSIDISDYKSSIEFFKDNGYEVIPAYNTNTGEWIEYSSVKADYTFYDRPYDTIPEEFCASCVFKYSKVCYIPYGFILTDSIGLLNVVFPPDFFFYTYAFFASWDGVADFAEKFYQDGGKSKHNVVRLGYPRFDIIGNIEQKFDLQYPTILWLPRFSINEEKDKWQQGTSFFLFKDYIIERAKNNSDEKWMIRPHPLAFTTFVSKGVMTKDEIEDYKSSINDLGNTSLDTNKNYLSAFKKTDVFVTDFSSLIIEMAVTGKPIIYLGDINAIPMPELRNCVYQVNNTKSLDNILDKLKSGIDELSEYRNKFRRSLTASDSTIGNDILEWIINDYYNNHYYRGEKNETKS